jgi:hypothetical protein
MTSPCAHNTAPEAAHFDSSRRPVPPALKITPPDFLQFLHSYTASQVPLHQRRWSACQLYHEQRFCLITKAITIAFCNRDLRRLLMMRIFPKRALMCMP